MEQDTFPCEQCGGNLEFTAGSNELECPHCGHVYPIEIDADPIEELDYEEWIQNAMVQEETHEIIIVKCATCAAEFTSPPNVTATACPFCGANIVSTKTSRKALKPKSLLPFSVPSDKALAAFRGWIKGLWFAPGKLKRHARHDNHLNGMYTPYWTYDCSAVTRYSGRRGDDYWTNETKSKVVGGQTVTQTERVKKTRWRWVNGVVHDRFDDVLVMASESLPYKHAQRLEPWDLDQLVPYKDEFLSGYRAESYQTNLTDGFTKAKEIMQPKIRSSVMRDIGGDHQTIFSCKSTYSGITFKHVLLPIWISAYRYHGRVYRFLVNARTGEVQGERPWSWIKIALVILLAVSAIVAIVAFMEYKVATS